MQALRSIPASVAAWLGRGSRAAASRQNNRSRLIYGGLVVLLLSLWHRIVVHEVTLRAVATFAVIVAVSFAYGRFVLRRTTLAKAGRSTLALEFMLGFLLLDAVLFALVLATPLGVTWSVAIAAVAAIAAWLRDRRASRAADHPNASACIAALVLCGIATTLWCSDALTPMVREGPVTVFRLWGDSFFHARLISAFGNAHGFAGMSDVRMAGAPLFLYHYASYVVPGAVSALTRAGAYETFASFMLPCGVLLTGLAASAFAAALWGRWPGVAAAFALLMIPDGYQQGFGNKYLSYNFMQQVNASGLYGVVCMALAWIFMLHGCRSRSVGSVLAGWAIALATLPFKAHVFVANAFLIMIYPVVFMAGPKLRWRASIAALLVGCFVLAVVLSQPLDRVPTLRLDGSGARPYVAYLVANQDPGPLASFVAQGLGAPPWPAPRVAFYGIVLVLLGTFGFWSAAAVATALWIRARTQAAVWAFPLLVIANYLTMALGLAMDAKGIGSPDELLNRPLVWAYFVVAAWTAGAAYHRLFGDRLPVTIPGRAAIASAALLGFAVPLTLASNLQTFPHWEGFGSLREAGSLPTCLVESARYIRDHGKTSDVVQDSDNDPRVWVTALAERADYAMYATNRPPAGLDARLADLAAFRRMTDARDIEAFAARHGIDWYLLRPASDVAWPQSLRGAAVFECGGYRVLRFSR